MASPFWLRGMSIISNQKKKFYREITVRSFWDRELWLTELSVTGTYPTEVLFRSSIFGTTNGCWMIALLGRGISSKLVIENTNAPWQISLNLLRVVRGLVYPFIDKAEETVAELTYKKAFEDLWKPLPDIVDLGLKKN